MGIVTNESKLLGLCYGFYLQFVHVGAKVLIRNWRITNTIFRDHPGCGKTPLLPSLHPGDTPCITRKLFLKGIFLPHSVTTQYLHFIFHASYFLLPLRTPEEISR